MKFSKHVGRGCQNQNMHQDHLKLKTDHSLLQLRSAHVSSPMSSSLTCLVQAGLCKMRFSSESLRPSYDPSFGLPAQGERNLDSRHGLIEALRAVHEAYVLQRHITV